MEIVRTKQYINYIQISCSYLLKFFITENTVIQRKFLAQIVCEKLQLSSTRIKCRMNRAKVILLQEITNLLI